MHITIYGIEWPKCELRMKLDREYCLVTAIGQGMCFCPAFEVLF